VEYRDIEIERAMVLFAHPDDAEFGMAGTAAAWARDGVEVVYVLVTNGASGSSDPDMTREKLAALRLAEQQEAAAMLGVKDVVALGFEDGYLYPDLELRKAVAREIRRLTPDAVLTSDPTQRMALDGYINHPDHIAVGEVAMRSINPDASSGLMFPDLWRDEGLAPHLPKALMLGQFEGGGDAFVDITDTIELKLMALACHRSQHDNAEETIGWLRDHDRAGGERHGVGYAETYRLIKLG